MKLPTTDEAQLRLARMPLLAGMPPDELARIASGLSWRWVKRRAPVIFKGSEGDHLLFLADGRLQVVDVTEGGQEVGLNLLSAGDYFGELSIIDGGTRSASVVAIENSLIALMPKSMAWDLFHRNPLVAQRILLDLAAKLRNASVYQTILCLPHASQRVYALLQRLSRVAPGGGLVVIDNAPKQRELAIIANTSRESVSRAMALLVDQGVLEKDNTRWIVRKPRELERLALVEGGMRSEVL